MKKDLPPEERLLRLIREGDKQPKEAKEHSWPERVLPAKAKAKEPIIAPRKKIPFLKFFNYILLIAAVGLMAYLAGEIFALLKQEKNILPSIPAQRKAPLKDEGQKIDTSPKPYSYYSQEIGKKELFKTSILQGQENQGSAAPAPTLSDLTSNLVLLGIVLDDEPQAIIEDKKAKKSYFLYKGDSIGEIKVEDIQESKVVLSYEEEKVELVP